MIAQYVLASILFAINFNFAMNNAHGFPASSPTTTWLVADIVRRSPTVRNLAIFVDWRPDKTREHHYRLWSCLNYVGNTVSYVFLMRLLLLHRLNLQYLLTWFLHNTWLLHHVWILYHWLLRLLHFLRLLLVLTLRYNWLLLHHLRLHLLHFHTRLLGYSWLFAFLLLHR